MTGGEHLVSLGAVEALSQTYPDLHILHFDAHADLREDYLGDTLSHACVLRRCHEILGDDRIVQLGIRSMTAQERAWAKVHVIQHPFDFSHLEDAIKKLVAFLFTLPWIWMFSILLFFPVPVRRNPAGFLIWICSGPFIKWDV